MKKDKLQIGTKIKFNSGNFQGLEGIIENLDWNSKNPMAIYGYLHKVRLSNGNLAFIEKSEHFKIIK